MLPEDETYTTLARMNLFLVNNMTTDTEWKVYAEKVRSSKSVTVIDSDYVA